MTPLQGGASAPIGGMGDTPHRKPLRPTRNRINDLAITLPHLTATLPQTPTRNRINDLAITLPHLTAY